MTKPIIFIPFLCGAIHLAGHYTPFTGLFLTAVRIIRLLSGFLGLILYIHDQFLSEVSQAYKDQSKQAAKYIQKIESSKEEFVFSLAE